MLEAMTPAILVGSLLVTVAIFTSLISFRLGAPLLLVFLLLGLLAGEDGLLGLEYDDSSSAYFIGSIALAIILFDSGFGTPAKTLRAAAFPALSLATVGVIVTAGLVGLVVRALLGVSWLEAFLLGAIVSSTDAAAVFFLLRAGGITLRERVRATLEVESSSNDPMAIFLTIALVELIAAGAGGERATLALILDFVLQLGLGMVFGLVGGLAISRIIDRTDFDAGLYPIIFLALALALFAITALLNGSGFLAVYVAGLVVGNARMRHGAALRRFTNALTWLCQIAMFLTLGLLATPSEFGRVAAPAVLIALFLMLVARPLAVWLCLLPFRFSRNEAIFIAWVGLRGAVSILLAIVPMLGGLGVGRDFFNIAFIIVLASLLIQGWSIGWVARRLRLIVPVRQGPVERIELELPGRGDHEIVAYKVHPESRVAKGERIPRWARPSLILRDGVSLRAETAGRPQPGDQIYIVTSGSYVALLDRLFAGPAEAAADSRLYGAFALHPDARLGEVADSYGVQVPEGARSLTLRDYLVQELAGDVEEGDRVSLGHIDLIVRRINAAHGIEEVGLGIEPGEAPRPRLPFLPHWRGFSRRLGGRRRAEPASPSAAAPSGPLGGDHGEVPASVSQGATTETTAGSANAEVIGPDLGSSPGAPEPVAEGASGR